MGLYPNMSSLVGSNCFGQSYVLDHNSQMFKFAIQQTVILIRAIGTDPITQIVLTHLVYSRLSCESHGV